MSPMDMEVGVRDAMGARRRAVVAVAVVGALLLAVLGGVSGSGAATAGPTLDDFECYTATAATTAAVRVPFSGTPSKVSLTSNFPSGRFVAAPGAVRLHCNPVQTTVRSLTTPVTNPNAHLLCDTVSATGLKLPLLVTLKNQFGTGELRLTAAQSLCMPSWENDTTPAHFPTASTPPNLDADVCYVAVHPTGTPSFVLPTSVQLKDQYTTRSTSVASPNLVCVPSAVTVNGSTTELVNPTRSLVCFAIAANVAGRTVYDKNQFGVGAVKLGQTSELCVPSVKAVVVPPTTTTTTKGSTTTTTTTVPTPIVTNYVDPTIAAPYDITTGSDGALWFTNYGGTSAANSGSIGRITTNGTVTSYTDPTISLPDGMTAGSDGAIWFGNTGNQSIGRITTDTAHTITNFTSPAISTPNRITAGAFNLEWFTDSGANSVGWLTSGGAVQTYTDPNISDPQGITQGPDGAMWFANFKGNSIGRVTVGGSVTIYTDPSIWNPQSITAGPDGALWYTNVGPNTIGRITTTGTVTSYSDPSISDPAGITAGPDGALWFTNFKGNSIGRITTTGTVTNYTDPSIAAPDGITAGPDHAIWFTNTANNSIGRISTP